MSYCSSQNMISILYNGWGQIAMSIIIAVCWFVLKRIKTEIFMYANHEYYILFSGAFLKSYIYKLKLVLFCQTDTQFTYYNKWNLTTEFCNTGVIITTIAGVRNSYKIKCFELCS